MVGIGLEEDDAEDSPGLKNPTERFGTRTVLPKTKHIHVKTEFTGPIDGSLDDEFLHRKEIGLVVGGDVHDSQISHKFSRSFTPHVGHQGADEPILAIAVLFGRLKDALPDRITDVGMSGKGSRGCRGRNSA